MSATSRDQPRAQELERALLAQPVDVHRPARDEVLDVLEHLAGAAGAVRADRPHAALGLDRRACRRRGSAPAARGGSARPLAPCAFGRRRHHPRDHVAGARDDHLVARRARPCGAGPPRCGASRASRSRRETCTGSSVGERHHVPGPPDVPHHAVQRWWWRSSAGTSRRSRRAARGPPRRGRAGSRRWLTFTTAPSISKSSPSRRSSQARQAAARCVDVVVHAHVRADLEAVLGEPVERLLVGRRTPSPRARRRSRPRSTAAATAAIAGSSWRIEPAAELRGLAKVGSPAAARSLVELRERRRAAGTPRRAPRAAAGRPRRAAGSP